MPAEHSQTAESRPGAHVRGKARPRDDATDPAMPASRPPDDGVARHNLPTPSTSFVGRERERVEIARALGATRLLTLTGVGGCGKTRLALAVAEETLDRFPGGIWLVELAPVAEPAGVPGAVAAALGVQEAPGGDLFASVLAFLRERTLLLVLDNCEHLIEACAAFAARALAAAPGLRLLATSREPLQIGGEQQWRVAPLAVPAAAAPLALAELGSFPAVALFVARARAVAPDFRLAPGNAAAVAGVCARLDGLPLALELAAARVRVLAVEQILARLDDSVRLLTGGSRAGPTRQQTLRAALDWSYDLLTEAERAAFRALTVFVGGWTVEAAEAVCAGDDLDPAELLDVLTRLVDKSLVQVEAGPGAAWYRLLEPVRQYGAGRLAAACETADARARHAACYVALAERAAPALRGPEQAAWLDRLERGLRQISIRAAGEEGKLLVAWRD